MWCAGHVTFGWRWKRRQNVQMWHHVGATDRRWFGWCRGPSRRALVPSSSARRNSIPQGKPLRRCRLSSFLLHESRCISLRLSTWSLHLWFRKPRTEAKDSLCGVGGRERRCVAESGGRRTHADDDSLLLPPSFPATLPPPNPCPSTSLFLCHVVAGLLIIAYLLPLPPPTRFSYCTILRSALSKQHVCWEFRRMHLVTRMSHTSSGLRASPSGWMNERVVGLAGGELHWLKGDSPCQLLNKRRRRKIGMYRRVSGRRAGGRRGWPGRRSAPPPNGGCPKVAQWWTSQSRLSHRLRLFIKNNQLKKNISSPALTPEDSHSAKVLRPWEGSPDSGSGEEWARTCNVRNLSAAPVKKI